MNLTLLAGAGALAAMPATVPRWTGTGASDAMFGSALGAGDFDGDGRIDLVVGALDDGGLDAGRVHLFLGGTCGPSALPGWSVTANDEDSEFGAAVAAGDVDGDGFDDVLVGAPEAGFFGAGEVFLYRGSAAGPSAVADWSFAPPVPGRLLAGGNVAAADLDGDGLAEVLVGAHLASAGGASAGIVGIFRGSSTLPGNVPDWEIEGDQEGAYLGFSLAAGGDVDADGYLDLVVGAYGWDGGLADEGRVQLHRGSASGPSIAPDWTAQSSERAAHLGSTVDLRGDIDGDGHADVVGGAEDAGDSSQGAVLLWYGSPTGPSAVHDWRAESVQGSAQLGGGDLVFSHSLATNGDADGDGYDDILVGAPGWDEDETDEGAAFLFRGSPSGPADVPDWTVQSDERFAELGTAVAYAGDLDGDGADDPLVGAYGMGAGGVALLFTTTFDEDCDGYRSDVDCDDEEATVYPGAAETCDGRDNDCDGVYDEGFDLYYADEDGDGFGDPDGATTDCTPPEGWVADATDCDDANAEVHPGAVDGCGGIDDDCDTEVDEDCAPAGTTGPRPTREAESGGCGCASGPTALGAGPLLLALGLVVRRRRHG